MQLLLTSYGRRRICGDRQVRNQLLKQIQTSPQAQNQTVSSNRFSRVCCDGYTTTPIKNNTWKPIVLVIAERCSELTGTISSSKTTFVHIANLFLEHRIILFGILAYLLTVNELQFLSKFYDSISGYLASKHLTTTAYHSHKNSQTERYIRVPFREIDTMFLNTGEIGTCSSSRWHTRIIPGYKEVLTTLRRAWLKVIIHIDSCYLA